MLDVGWAESMHESSTLIMLNISSEISLGWFSTFGSGQGSGQRGVVSGHGAGGSLGVQGLSCVGLRGKKWSRFEAGHALDTFIGLSAYRCGLDYMG